MEYHGATDASVQPARMQVGARVHSCMLTETATCFKSCSRLKKKIILLDKHAAHRKQLRVTKRSGCWESGVGSQVV